MINKTIHLDNLDREDGTVLVMVFGEGAQEFADQDQSIQGCNWECDGSDFAYALIDDYSGLIKDLAKEYDLNLDDYFYPEEIQ